MPEDMFDRLGQQAENEIDKDFKKGHDAVLGSAGTKSAEDNGGADASEWARNLRVEDISGERPGKTKAASGQGSTDVEDFISFDNKGFFAKMSEDGRGIMRKMYDGLYKIPGVSQIVGKLKIADSQDWMNYHQERAVFLKEKMGELESQREVLRQVKQDIEGNIAELKRLGVPSVESLQLQLKEMSVKDAKLATEKDSLQSELEAQNNKAKLYANERDEIVERLVGHYDEKLKPMEQELEKWNRCRNQADLLISAMEVKHGEELERLASVEKQRDAIEASLRKVKTSEDRIKKALEPYTTRINKGREKIKTERENMARKQKEINERIAKLDAKANSYRDKREELIRIKEGRPIDVQVEARKRRAELKGREETRSHTRENEEPITISEEELESLKASKNQSAGDVSPKSEHVLEKNQRLTVADCISAYNAHIRETGGADVKELRIDSKDFLKATMWLSKDSRLDFRKFKELLKKYYKFKEITSNNFEKNISDVKAKLEA